MRILGKRTLGQNLQVLLVVFPGVGFISQFFLAHGETEAGKSIAIFVVKSFLVAFERGFVVFALEVKVAHLNIFQRLHRVPGMELLDAGNFNTLGDVEIFDGRRAAGMVLGVVLGWADIDSRIAAGAFLGLAIAGGSLFRGGLVRGILRQRNSRQQR